jgi:RNA polymerase sigma-70 factor (ECF subfamily)
VSSVVELAEGGLEEHRAALTGYCYRMLGSVFEAEDAVQETMLRAWRALDRYEGRAALRTWLFSIATNVCLDMLRGKGRRVMPVDLGRSWPATAEPAVGLPERVWVEPVPDSRVLPDGDPGEVAAARDTIRLAFVAALQHLLPRQRAVLILRDVLGWHAAEVAELLDTSVVAVKSTLQRARATLAERDPGATGARSDPLQGEDRALVDRYVDAFERFDIEALVALLHEDATLSMPPHPLWVEGREQVRRWWYDHRAVCAGSRLVPVAANGSPAVAQFRPDGAGSVEAFALQVLDVSDGRIRGVTAFLEPRLFPLFSPLPSTPRDGRRPHLRPA